MSRIDQRLSVSHGNMKGQAIRRHGQIIGLTNPNLSLIALGVTAYYKAELCQASKANGKKASASVAKKRLDFTES